MSRSQSGLGKLQRDWSNATDSSASSSADLIEWEPTQQTKKPEPSKDDKMATANKRLLLIKQALASMNADAPASSSAANPLSKSAIADPNRPASKRPILQSDDGAPAKKRRELPPSWRDDGLSNSAFKGRDRSISTNGTQKSSGNLPTPSSSASSTSTKPSQVAPIFLSQEQTHILKLVKDGCSVFYTGSAGAGKSVLLREIINAMRVKHSRSPEAVAITASTGIAACNIGGVTIHSFAGIGIGDGDVKSLMTKIRKNKKAAMRWAKVKVLIIDEVSMLDGDLFDKLAEIGCIIKKQTEPFGGIQLVVTGDFFQLPPVTKYGAAPVKFAFEAEHWSAAVQKTFNLTKVFRQKDQEFVNMLNEMRFGRLSQKSIAKFRSLSRNVVYEDGLGPTELFPRREDVERSNALRMQRLLNEEITYPAVDGGGSDPMTRDKMLANFMAPKELRLRVEAQVMLIKNIDETLVNGTMGRVIAFMHPTNLAESSSDIANGVGITGAIPKKSNVDTTKPWPQVEFSLANGKKRNMLVSPETWKIELQSGEVQASRIQFPLILAWAMSIHKSQGQTLERVKVDLNRIFEKGQAYVALSRATSLDGLQVLNFDPRKVNAHERVAVWSRTLETIAERS